MLHTEFYHHLLLLTDVTLFLGLLVNGQIYGALQDVVSAVTSNLGGVRQEIEQRKTGKAGER